MSWDVFAGELNVPLLATLALRATKDGVPATKSEMAAYFKSHLERGILQLQNVKDLISLSGRVCQNHQQTQDS